MKQLLSFLKQHKKATILIIVVITCLTIGIPLLINWMFEIPALCDFFAVNWEAVDALSYYGDVLSFLGTVALSGLALWQNHEIQQADDKHTQLLEQMEKEKNAPFLVLTDLVVSGHSIGIELSLRNLNNNIAQDVTVRNAKIVNSDGTVAWKDVESYSTAYIHCQKDFRFKILTPGITDPTQRIIFDVELYDIFGELHRYTAVGVFLENRSWPTFVMKKER